jgi:hypothetical protein
VFGRSLTRERRAHLVFGFAVFGGTVLLMVVPGRTEVWQALPLLKQAQYSARLLVLIGFPAAIAAASAVLWTWSRPLVVGILLGSAILYGFAFGRPIHSQRADDVYFLTNTPILYGAADWDHTVLPKGAGIDISAPTDDPRPSLSPNRGSVVSYAHESTVVHASVDVPDATTLILPVYDFPGWQVRVDGETVAHGRVDLTDTATRPVPKWAEPDTIDGAITVELPAGRHDVTARFTDTTERRLGNYLSLASAMSLVAFSAITFVRARKRSLVP